jgi:hypothetical protein
MRRWADPSGCYVVRLYETGQTDRWGKTRVDYEVYHCGWLIFVENLWVPTCDTIDGNSTLSAAITFSTTELDFYTPEQLEWIQIYGEELAQYDREWLDENAMEDDEFSSKWEDCIP